MLSEESLRKIDLEVSKYPSNQKRSATMSALRIAQVENGYLTPQLIEFVAQYLELPPIAVYEVATFYNMYDLKPVGKHKLTVCTNLPCALSGGYDIAEYLKSELGIDFGQTTKDGMFTLQEGECMGACGDAPVIIHNNHKMCSHMSKEEVDKKLKELGFVRLKQET